MFFSSAATVQGRSGILKTAVFVYIGDEILGWQVISEWYLINWNWDGLENIVGPALTGVMH